MSIYDGLDKTKFSNIKLHVEDNSKVIDDIVSEIISPYCGDLDRYVAFIKKCLADGEHPPTNSELEDFCLNLSTQIYFAGGFCEQLGVRDDVAKAVYKEMYNTSRDGAGGTVQDKNSFAELQSQQEQLVSICYTRAYKTLKAKVDAAQELMSSCKKVLSHRIQEEQLTNMSSNLGT